MKKAQEIDVKGTSVRIVKFGVEDYVCITDMAKSKSDDAQQTISNWMRNRMTIEYLGLWEKLYNPDFKPFEFEGFRKDVGLNSFTRSPSKWIDRVHFIPQLVRPATGERYASPLPFPAMGSDSIEVAVRFAKAFWLDFFPQLIQPATGEFYACPSYQYFWQWGQTP